MSIVRNMCKRIILIVLHGKINYAAAIDFWSINFVNLITSVLIKLIYYAFVLTNIVTE